jgi:UDP-N-acetylglucosamine pyrophosphorylase
MPKSKIAKAWEAAGYTRITLGPITNLTPPKDVLVVNGVTQETE